MSIRAIRGSFFNSSHYEQRTYDLAKLPKNENPAACIFVADGNLDSGCGDRDWVCGGESLPAAGLRCSEANSDKRQLGRIGSPCSARNLGPALVGLAEDDLSSVREAGARSAVEYCWLLLVSIFMASAKNPWAGRLAILVRATGDSVGRAEYLADTFFSSLARTCLEPSRQCRAHPRRSLLCFGGRLARRGG